jgi:hypothetical protein
MIHLDHKMLHRHSNTQHFLEQNATKAEQESYNCAMKFKKRISSVEEEVF